MPPPIDPISLSLKVEGLGVGIGRDRNLFWKRSPVTSSIEGESGVPKDGDEGNPMP